MIATNCLLSCGCVGEEQPGTVLWEKHPAVGVLCGSVGVNRVSVRERGGGV